MEDLSALQSSSLVGSLFTTEGQKKKERKERREKKRGKRKEKRLSRDVYILLPLTYSQSSLVMTSLRQTAGHKMAALTVIFSQLSNVDF